MKQFVISENDSNQRLDKFISKAVPLLPTSLMYKYIRIKRIKVNGKRTEISTRLAAGDAVDMYISDEFFGSAPEKYDFLRAAKKLTIVYEDENLILCDKPTGLLSHPDNDEFCDTLITRIKRYLYEKKEWLPDAENSFVPALVNRIDRNTCGIVIAAKNAEALRILNEKMKNREIKKYYLCIAHGRFRQKSGTLEGFLSKNEEQNRVYIKDKQEFGAKTIRTRYRVLEEINGDSVLEVELLTGRTHQIRAHLASLGHPLLGDGKYGTNAINRGSGFKTQALCSYKTVFEFTGSSGALDYLNGTEFTVRNVWFLPDMMQKEICSEVL